MSCLLGTGHRSLQLVASVVQKEKSTKVYGGGKAHDEPHCKVEYLAFVPWPPLTQSAAFLAADPPNARPTFIFHILAAFQLPNYYCSQNWPALQADYLRNGSPLDAYFLRTSIFVQSTRDFWEWPNQADKSNLETPRLQVHGTSSKLQLSKSWLTPQIPTSCMARAKRVKKFTFLLVFFFFLLTPKFHMKSSSLIDRMLQTIKYAIHEEL